MSGIEDLVRRSLHERVALAPALDDPAGRAVAGARTRRRRRALIAACAAGLVGVLVTGALAGLRGGPHTLPVPPATVPPPSPAGVAVIVDHHALRLPDGRSVTLPAADQSMSRAVQVRQGWLVTATVADSSRLAWWLVTGDGAVRPLVQELTDAPVVSADGLLLAWRDGTRLFTGHLTDGGGLAVDASTPMPAKGGPIAVTGAAVVLGATATGGGIDSYDLWLPARGDYVPSWNVITNVAAVYGPLPGGRSVLGLVHPATGGKEVCLADLDPASSLRATRTACTLPLRADPAGAVSPDGHWLAAVAAGGVALVDLTTVFQRPAVATTWHADGPGVWVDADTMVAPAPGGLRRFHAGGGPDDPLAIPGVPSGAHLDLVPRAEPV